MAGKRPLIQLDICTAIKALKNIGSKKKNIPMEITSEVIEIVDEDDEQITVQECIPRVSKLSLAKRKLPCEFSSDEDDFIPLKRNAGEKTSNSSNVLKIKTWIGFDDSDDEEQNSSRSQNNDAGPVSHSTPKKNIIIGVNKPNINYTPLKSDESSNKGDSSSKEVSLESSASNETTVICDSIKNSTKKNVLIHSQYILPSDQTLGNNNHEMRINNNVSSNSNGLHLEKEKKVLQVSEKSFTERIINKPTGNLSSVEKTSTKKQTILKTNGSPTTNASHQPSCSKSPKNVKSIDCTSPKTKTEKKINLNLLTLINELFLSINKLTYKNIINKEAKILKTFMETHENRYQYVCLKLFTRRPIWYNVYKFCSLINLDMEDDEIYDMYKFLRDNAIIDTDYSKEDIMALLNLLNKHDVKSICDKFKLKNTIKKKDDLICYLLKHSKTQSTLSYVKSTKDLIKDEIIKKMGICMKLNENFRNAFYNVYLMGTFVNPTFANINDYINTVLYQNVVFPEYDVEDYCVFYSRQEFTSYAKARRLYDDLDMLLVNRNFLKMLQVGNEMYNNLLEINGNTDDMHKNAPHLKRFTAKSVYLKGLSVAARSLLTRYPKAVRVWLEYMIKTVEETHWIGDWYYSLTWLYMKYLEPVDFEYAAKLLIKVLQEKNKYLSEIQLQHLSQRGEQLKTAKKHKINQMLHDMIAQLVPKPVKLNGISTISINASAIRSNDPGKKRNYVTVDAEGNKSIMNVEITALEYYKNRCGYTDGMHCEGILVKASFTLFFWDIIYNPETNVPGTFISKLQSVPLDMYTQYFYSNRKAAIDKRLKEIETDWSHDMMTEFLTDKFNKHSHETAFCEVGQHICNVELLEQLVSCVGRKVLSKIYERFVKNIKAYGKGMPDLLIWNAEEKTSKFVEVKGEGDTLSIEQILWLHYLKSIGANTEVCHVHSIGSKRKKILKKVEKEKPQESASSSR